MDSATSLVTTEHGLLSDSSILPARVGYTRRVFRLSTALQRYARSLVYVSILSLVSLLPLSLAYRTARRLGRLLAAFHPARREACTTRLRARFGMNRADADVIARRAFELKYCDDLDAWLLPRLTRESLVRVISFEGLAHLDAALANGRGAVLYTGHTWGSRLCISGLALLGYPIVLVRRRIKTGSADPARRWLSERSQRTFEADLGGRIVGSADGRGSVAIGAVCVSALRRNEIVLVRPDVVSRKNIRRGDHTVNFLNGEEAFRPGGVLIARAAGSAVIPMSVHRPVNLVPSRCVLGPPLDQRDDVRATLEAQAAQIEREVRQDPACWTTWLNPRRKSSTIV